MRVLVVAAETSVAAALNMMPEWEVVFATDADHVASEAKRASVVLIGGGTGSALGVIEQLGANGIHLPAVILGDTPAPDGVATTVLMPPFTLDELRAAVEGALANGSQAPVPPAAEDAYDEQDEDEPLERAEMMAELSSVAVEAPEEARIALPTVEEGEPDPVVPPRTGSRPRPVQPPEPAQMAAVQVPPRAAPPEVAAPLPYEPEAPQRRQSRRARRQQAAAAAAPAPAPAEPGVVRRLRNAAAAAGDLEAALDELPILADLEGLAEALLAEVRERLGPQVAAIYVPGPKGFRAAAAHGLSSAERGMIVDHDQPLFAEIRRTREPMLIAPVDLARGLVLGIGGAHTDAMMAAPVMVGDRCVSVIVVGRGDFLDPDLDTVAAIAREAAPGLAVALLVDRILEL